MGVLEIAKPATQGRVDRRNDVRDRVAPVTLGQSPDFIPQPHEILPPTPLRAGCRDWAEPAHRRPHPRMGGLRALATRLIVGSATGSVCRRRQHLTLFDGWCEQRSVIPFAYLLHAWPILTADPTARARLLNTLQELQQFHPESLTQDEHQIIEEALDAHVVKNNTEGSSP